MFLAGVNPPFLWKSLPRVGIVAGCSMGRYEKGANAERELIKKLFECGFSVARVAGSGASVLPAPDILAFSKTKRLGFECKAWERTHLTIPTRQFEELVQWSKNADCQAVFAWKVSHEGWFFLFPEAFHKTGKAYAISRRQAAKKSLNFLVLIGKQTQLARKK